MALKVLHITTGLESGGAEMLLFQTVSRLNRDLFECAVISLTDDGPLLGERIRAQGVPVVSLGFPRGLPHPRMLTELAQAIRLWQPDIVQTWMYHADLLGGLSTKLAGKSPVVWGIHNTDLAPGKAKRTTRAVVAVNRLLSHWLPEKIVCCSEAARALHVGIGFRSDRMEVIVNGVDTQEFIPSPAARVDVRRELGIPAETPLIGLIARFDPQKDHRTFFKAAGLLHQARPDVHFLLSGTGITMDNAQLRSWIDEAQVTNAVHLLGLRSDTPRLTAALDIATCCSYYGESFSLVLAEAMSCEVACVTTNMEGPVSVVGDCGKVVPVQNPQALAAKWQEILQQTANERQAHGAKSRQRIRESYSAERMVNHYESLYQNIAEGGGKRGL